MGFVKILAGMAVPLLLYGLYLLYVLNTFFILGTGLVFVQSQRPGAGDFLILGGVMFLFGIFGIARVAASAYHLATEGE